MKKLRQSNIELLRIISMLLVLMVHADFTSIGTPSRDLMLVSPGQFTFRVLVEFLSVLCVDIFVVISGWFSIRLSVRGLCNYLWQCLYFSVTPHSLSLVSICSRVTCASITITSLHLTSWVFSSVQFWQMLLYFQPMYISGPILPPAYA